MSAATTARILANKALQLSCGQECVDWAISMLEQGCDGRYVAMLAGMSPPFNHFEVADYRDRSLQELGIEELSGERAVIVLSADLLRLMLAGKQDILETLAVIKDLCVAREYPRDLYDFYLLYFAYEELLDSEDQFYWHGATRENIVAIIRTRAEAFLRANLDRISVVS